MDEPETTTEEAPSSETVETTESSEHPWGEDFDAQRAWNTIQNLRNESRELKQHSQRVKELEQQWDDDEALIARLQERGYEFDDGAEYEDYADYEDPDEQRLSAQEARLAQLEAEQAWQAFNADLDELAEEAEVTLSPRDRRFIEQACFDHGANDKALKKAFKEYVEEREAYDKGVIDSYVKGKKNTPRVTGSGSEATERLDLDNDNERVRAMTERWLQSRAES